MFFLSLFGPVTDRLGSLGSHGLIMPSGIGKKEVVILRVTFLGLMCLMALCVSAYAVDNMVVNPDFDDPLDTGWNLEVHADQVVATMELDNTTSVVGGNSARIDIESIVDGAEVWRLQFKQMNISVKADMTYTWSFWAKTVAGGQREGTVSVGMETDPWAGLGLSETFELEADWQEYYFTFAATESFDNTRLAIQLASSPESVWIDHVKFYLGDYVQEEMTATEPMGKMTATWGSIKSDIE